MDALNDLQYVILHLALISQAVPNPQYRGKYDHIIFWIWFVCYFILLLLILFSFIWAILKFYWVISFLLNNNLAYGIYLIKPLYLIAFMHLEFILVQIAIVVGIEFMLYILSDNLCKEVDVWGMIGIYLIAVYLGLAVKTAKICASLWLTLWKHVGQIRLDLLFLLIYPLAIMFLFSLSDMNSTYKYWVFDQSMDILHGLGIMTNALKKTAPLTISPQHSPFIVVFMLSLLLAWDFVTSNS
ncbi:hypothetical protein ACJX0J_013174, partial [Zea mays]